MTGSTRDSAVRVGLVYPELLGTYGDRGNAIVLVQRCRWRGIPAELVEVDAGAAIPDSLDIYLFGGGEDDPQPMAAEGMRGSRAAVDRAHADGAVVFAVCAGFQLLGHSYDAADGSVIEGMGFADLVTRAGTRRLIGEVIVEPTSSPLWGSAGAPSRLTGFENHGGRTTLGAGLEPLGAVVRGAGTGTAPAPTGCSASVSSARTCTDPSSRATRSSPTDCSLGSPRRWQCAPGARLRPRAATPSRTRSCRVSTRGIRKWWQDRRLARG